MVRELIIDPELEKCLPPLPEMRFQQLRARIEEKYDPAKPIVLWKERPNTIVDGHHRYKICQELGVEPTTIEESFASLDDALLYTLQRQVEQRNLTDAQIVIVTEQMMSISERQRLVKEAKESAIESVGRDNKGVFKSIAPLSEHNSDNGLSREVAQRIADKAGSSARTVYQVHAVQNKGVPEIVKMVESGEIGSGYANDFVQQTPKEKQSEIIKSGGLPAVKEIVRSIRTERAANATAQKEAEERRKFQEFNQKVAQKTAEAHHTIDLIMDASGGGCLMPNMAELWCSDCQWGFDVFLPMPSAKSHCPYCRGENITKRESSWNPRLAITKKEL